jgi:hypothetical protein
MWKEGMMGWGRRFTVNAKDRASCADCVELQVVRYVSVRCSNMGDAPTAKASGRSVRRVGPMVTKIGGGMEVYVRMIGDARFATFRSQPSYRLRE